MLPTEQLQALRDVKQQLDLGGRDSPDTVGFLGRTFVAGSAPDIVTLAHEGDVAEIVAAVRDARRQANWVIVSSHTHESGGRRDEPAAFLIQFARAVVDAGADIFVGHGPHVLRGIEIRRGRPIFYSLGNFVFQNETVALQPADNYESQDLEPSALPGEFFDRRNERRGGGWPAERLYWESVVPVVRFDGGSLAEIRLHPISLGYGLPRPQRGRPLMAEGELARKIIADLVRLSQPFGTDIRESEGIGLIRP